MLAFSFSVGFTPTLPDLDADGGWGVGGANTPIGRSGEWPREKV